MDILDIKLEELSTMHNLGSTKRNIILLLKKNREIDLKTIAQEMKMSKMGILKHINKLEELGIIKRVHVRQGVGRPRLHLILSEKAGELFPTNYSEIALAILDYIDEKYGRDEAINALTNRIKGIAEKYRKNFTKEMSMEEKIRVITDLRDRDGYMAEFTIKDSNFQILEYNCPLLDVADEYTEACEIERKMFEELVGESVTSSHQIVNGDRVCRFIIEK